MSVQARIASHSEAGVALLEVLVTAVVVGIAAVGVTFMFSFGNTWVVAKGDDRVALGLAQQKIEQLRSLGFACIPVSGPGTLGQVRGPNPSPCSSLGQVYNEGGTTWVMADGPTAPAPSNRGFTRLTCVQYVSDTAVGSPAYSGGTTGSPCAAGTGPPTNNTLRITVIVRPNQQRQADDPVILQVWMTAIPGGI